MVYFCKSLRLELKGPANLGKNQFLSFTFAVSRLDCGERHVNRATFTHQYPYNNPALDLNKASWHRFFCNVTNGALNEFCIILPVVLYGWETWSLTLREEHRLRVFENKVLRRMLGPRRDEVMEGWRKLHEEELRDLYSSPSIIRMIKSWRLRWAGHGARMGKI
jgi:hypothetical protein